MKTKIHPTWNDNTVVTCTCGNTFKTGSNKKQIQVEICADCHPFFTGEMKFIDTQGRVEKFLAKRKAAKNAPKKKSKDKDQSEQAKPPKSLKEMLSTQKQPSSQKG